MSRGMSILCVVLQVTLAMDGILEVEGRVLCYCRKQTLRVIFGWLVFVHRPMTFYWTLNKRWDLLWGEQNDNNTHFANALLTSRLISGGLWNPVGKFLFASHSSRIVSPMCVNTPLARQRKSTATFNWSSLDLRPASEIARSCSYIPTDETMV